MSEQKIQILNSKDIMEIYGLSKSDTYRLLHCEDCPKITGGTGGKFLIEKEAWENFLKRKNTVNV